MILDSLIYVIKMDDKIFMNTILLVQHLSRENSKLPQKHSDLLFYNFISDSW